MCKLLKYFSHSQNALSRDSIISKLSIHVIQFWTYLYDVKIIIKVCMLESDFGQLQNSTVTDVILSVSLMQLTVTP